MPRRPCLGTGTPCPRTAPPGKSRCDNCRSIIEARRGTRQQRGYDADYQRARADLLATRSPCYWCGQPATTADHDPPLAVPAERRVLRPACTTCNYGHRAAREAAGAS